VQAMSSLQRAARRTLISFANMRKSSFAPFENAQLQSSADEMAYQSFIRQQ